MLKLRRTTLYLNPRVHHALKLKAVQRNTSISELISEAVKYALKEDALDLEAVKDRAHEPARSFESALKDLKRNGLL